MKKFLADFDSNNKNKLNLNTINNPNNISNESLLHEDSQSSINDDNFNEIPQLESAIDIIEAQMPNYLLSNSTIIMRSKRHADKNVDEFVVDEPYALPLRPIVRGPFEADEQNLDEVSVIYVEPHSKIKLNCEVDLDVQSSVWLKDGQVVQLVENERSMGSRFSKEMRGGLSINNVMLEDDGFWQCEVNFKLFFEFKNCNFIFFLG